MTNVAPAGGSLSRWVNDASHVRFRQRVAVCNADLVSRFATWSRFDAGVFLMGLAWWDDPLNCMHTTALVADDSVSDELFTMLVLQNVAICESCDHERLPPSEWVEFAKRHRLYVHGPMLAQVAVYADKDVPIAGRTIDQLHRALGAALDIADLNPNHGDSMHHIVEQLNNKGARVDRQRLTRHIQAAFVKLDSSRAKLKRT